MFETLFNMVLMLDSEINDIKSAPTTEENTATLKQLEYVRHTYLNQLETM